MKINEILKESTELESLKWFPVDDPDLPSWYPVRYAIMLAIGATHYANWGKIGVPWSDEMIGGGGTYMLRGPFGHVMLDAASDIVNKYVLLSQISVEKRNSGLGNKIMNTIKSYADSKGYGVAVMKVTARDFFDKFDWLTPDEYKSTYTYNPNEQVNEITMDPRTGKDFNSYDLNEFIGRTEHVGDIKGREIHLFDEDGPEEFIYLIGDKNNEAFDGYMLIVQDRDGYYRTNVFFDQSIQGKGMAVPLYAFAIKHSGKTVVSDKTQTKGSKALWQKLANTPGINVYAWNITTNEYSHYDPDVETDEEIWQDTNALSNQHAEYVSKIRQVDYDHARGELSDEDWKEVRGRLYQQAMDLQNQGPGGRADIRLVATAK